MDSRKKRTSIRPASRFQERPYGSGETVSGSRLCSRSGNTQQCFERVYKRLVEPVLPHVTGKELIIVPHDVLHYLPFHALLGSDGRYLIEKYPITYLSSASLLQFVKEKRRAGGERILAFGNPDLGDPKMNLQFAEVGGQGDSKPLSTIFDSLRKEATEEKAKALSPNNDIIHFATHAELNEDDPLIIRGTFGQERQRRWPARSERNLWDGSQG